MRIDPTPAPMLQAIVKHVAAVAQSGKLGESAAAGIMIKVRAGQHHWQRLAIMLGREEKA